MERATAPASDTSLQEGGKIVFTWGQRVLRLL